MDEKTYNKLYEKLSNMLVVGGFVPPVSPQQVSGGAHNVSPGLFITPDIDLDKLNESKLYLVHTLLHKFYSGGNKSLSKEEIKKIHNKVKEKINHKEFDSLDRI